MRADEETRTELSLGDESVELTSGELDRLLLALTRLELREAVAVGEQIAALRLAGGAIRLTPTPAELAAVERALAGEV